MRLQTIDTQINNIHTRLSDIENILSEKSELIKSENQAMIAETTLADCNKQLQLTERNVKDQQLKIELTDKALYGGKIKNPKELQDLQNEAAALRRYLSVLEDRQLEAMINLEEAEIKHESAIRRLEDIKSKRQSLNKTLSVEQSKLTNDLNRLGVEREVVIHTIDKNDLELYEDLRENRRGIAVTSIVDQTCGACGATLTPAVRQTAQSLSQIIQCPSCRRIIYSN